MGYATSEHGAQAPLAVKILIAGGFGVGKTTMVGSVSEVPPLRTEEYLTHASVGVDDLEGLSGKSTTTVALDFGRITINDQLVLYLFGTPGQERFWFMWNDLVNGALGAVVLVDTRRLDVSFASIDFFENRGIPFVVGVNCFHGVRDRTPQEIRAALDLDPQVPLVLCDARDRKAGRDVLLTLIDHLMAVQERSTPHPVP
ncbi:GTP-binding protein [Nonomuraea gerenzanensis]|uniref:Putative ATP/GTP-binding protein n=1 Tax=Nonomuraea gerenzanensis TaxID=93944 RepID=A0A1M4EB01_9ACTN|nr:ATP/GTP-binding protein [Nonomuraea gerenzanensis]UBU18159.1 ATP/GTP-binding protein [Nonomuraea gerenzanensis]SBO95970.1 Putative ATP/GTP-binding protein [Nonomuraea gerenzanensis]